MFTLLLFQFLKIRSTVSYFCVPASMSAWPPFLSTDDQFAQEIAIGFDPNNPSTAHPHVTSTPSSHAGGGGARAGRESDQSQSDDETEREAEPATESLFQSRFAVFTFYTMAALSFCSMAARSAMHCARAICCCCPVRSFVSVTAPTFAECRSLPKSYS